MAVESSEENGQGAHMATWCGLGVVAPSARVEAWWPPWKHVRSIVHYLFQNNSPTITVQFRALYILRKDQCRQEIYSDLNPHLQLQPHLQLADDKFQPTAIAGSK